MKTKTSECQLWDFVICKCFSCLIYLKYVLFFPQKETCNASEDTSDTVFIAFARVYSGTIKKGQQLYVLGPKHDPAKALSTVSINLENS